MLSISTQDLFFCQSHWIFACYYFKIAKNIPIAISNQVVPSGTSRQYTRMYWAGIAINGVFPAMEAVFGVWLYTLADKGLETPDSLEVAFSVSIVGVCLVQVVSGVILIKSVLSIRKYLLAGAPERVNIKTLIV